MHTPTRRRQSGATLIEIVVSLLIFSLGVLGMVAMQAKAIGYAVDAEDRSRAARLANEIVAAMWVEGTRTPSILDAWKDRVQQAAVSGLPNASADVSDSSPDSNGVITTTVTITWHAPSKQSSETDNKYFTQVVLP